MSSPDPGRAPPNRFLRLFPLNTVLFRGMPLSLNVFEPRYRQLLQEVLVDEGRFGVVAIRAGLEVGEPAETHDVGTIARILSVDQLPDGRTTLLAVGEGRFRVLAYHHDRPYLSATIADAPDGEIGPGADVAAAAVAAALKRLLANYAEQAGQRLPAIDLSSADPTAVADRAAAVLNVTIAERQALLEATSVEARLAAINAIFQRELRLLGHLGPTTAPHPSSPRPSAN